MSNLAQKRMMLDAKSFQKSKANNELVDIFCHFDESNMAKVKAMIIGPTETPYEDGFYFFDIEFPSTYPLQPPKVQYCTLDGAVRFNPNLYANGKVCLSIINTWDGPKWVPCQNLSSVLLSIQSMILVKDPLKNEPCYYECTDRNILDPYNKAITFENHRVAILKMIQQTPPGFDVFLPIMEKHLVKNSEKILKRLIQLRDTVLNQTLSLNYYHMHSTIRYSDVYTNTLQLVNQITENHPEYLIPDTPVSVVEPEAIISETPQSISESVSEPQKEIVETILVDKKKKSKNSKSASAQPASAQPIIDQPISDQPASAQAVSVEPTKIYGIVPNKLIKASMKMKLNELLTLCVENAIPTPIEKKAELLKQIQQYNEVFLENCQKKAFH
jgi:ubiquitin-protein ligase